MKKIYRLLIAVFALVVFVNINNSQVFAANISYSNGGYDYILDDLTNEAKIITYDATVGGTAVTIPSVVNHNGTNFSVTEISTNSFASKNITSLVLPNTIKTIGINAFKGNQFTTVTIPQSVQTIGTSAFANGALVEVIIEEGLTSIGDSVFASNTLTTMTLPATLTNVSASAFTDSKLENVIVRAQANVENIATVITPTLDTLDVSMTQAVKMYALDNYKVEYAAGTQSTYNKYASDVVTLNSQYLGLIEMKNYEVPSQTWRTGLGSYFPGGTATYEWFKKDTPSDVSIATTSSVTITDKGVYYLKVNGTTTLSDITVKEIFTITYVLDGGTNNVSNPNEYIEGTGVYQFQPAIKSGYTFLGWFDQAVGGNKITNISNTEAANVTLYAHWNKIVHTITYNSNTGTGTVTDPTEYGVGENAVVKDSSGISKDGYTFTSWNTKADGTGTSYAPNSTITVNSFITLYAQWTEAKYTITYNANGATGSVVDSTNYASGSNVTIKSNTGMTRAGYTFVEWNTKADGTGIGYVANDTLVINENTTLYAQWKIGAIIDPIKPITPTKPVVLPETGIETNLIQFITLVSIGLMAVSIKKYNN